MRRCLISLLSCVALALVFTVSRAEAQLIGTFSWQFAPFCNIVTLKVTHVAGVYTLDGFDNQCGAVKPSPTVGVAVLHLNGPTVGMGLTIVASPGGQNTHIDAAIDLATLSGTWSDGALGDGTFVFNGPGGGAPRPSGASGLTAFGSTPTLVSRRGDGTSAAPLAVQNGQNLLVIAARGYDGAGFAGSSSAQISMTASENWTPNTRGAQIDFLTTPNGSTNTALRMRIDHSGQVGIRVLTPVDLLDVGGDIRIGTGTTGCVRDRDATVIAGVCASDARFKRDVASFEPMLNKVAALRPVHFYWRASEFPKRSFGERQSYGLMAQEVEEVLPELVTTDADGYKAVNYSKLPLIALQAIRELKEHNDALEARNAAIDAQSAVIERRLAELEARLKP